MGYINLNVIRAIESMWVNPALYMNMHYNKCLLIPEKQVTDINPLFDLATVPHDLQATFPKSSSTS